jgi:hypothetical protein
MIKREQSCPGGNGTSETVKSETDIVNRGSRSFFGKREVGIAFAGKDLPDPGTDRPPDAIARAISAMSAGRQQRLDNVLGPESSPIGIGRS